MKAKVSPVAVKGAWPKLLGHDGQPPILHVFTQGEVAGGDIRLVGQLGEDLD